jgi:hypothetical protein
MLESGKPVSSLQSWVAGLGDGWNTSQAMTQGKSGDAPPQPCAGASSGDNAVWLGDANSAPSAGVQAVIIGLDTNGALDRCAASPSLRTRFSRRSCSSLFPQTFDIGRNAFLIGGVEHQGAIGHPLDIAALIATHVSAELDGNLGRAHLFRVVFGEVAAEI